MSKAVFITGASTGIGHATINALNDDSGKMRYLTSDAVGVAENRQKLGGDGFVNTMRTIFFGE